VTTPEAHRAPDSSSRRNAITALRRDFPALHQTISGKRLAYLDSAASAQCPNQVIEAVAEQRRHNHANVHRGVHRLSQRATDAYEGAREKLRAFINAASIEEIVFTRGTTESINLVAASLGRKLLGPGDEVLVTRMEHHSNIVPWQMICEQTGARLVPAPITQTGEIDMPAFEELLTRRPKIVSLVHISNALGTINPVHDLVAKAHEVGAIVLIDGAQSVPHLPIDVQAMDCDFFACSGHKLFGPTGIGILYGKRALLDSMPPYQGGGEMILSVRFEATTYNSLPYKFEAGTPNITGAVGLGAAIDYLSALDLDAMAEYETELLDYATARLGQFPQARVIGTAREKASVLSFVIDGIHPHDLGTIVDQEGVCIRTGHHCAMPVMEFFGVPATARASFAFYNNREDIDQLMLGIERALEIFA
jgi:cysteine desulfurase/selenocysteine lyase